MPNKIFALPILILLFGCQNESCVDSEYVNCKVNKNSYEKIKIGINVKNLNVILDQKNVLKEPILGQARVLMEWDYSILWTRCSMMCGNQKMNPSILVKIKDGKVKMLEYSEK